METCNKVKSERQCICIFFNPLQGSRKKLNDRNSVVSRLVDGEGKRWEKCP